MYFFYNCSLWSYDTITENTRTGCNIRGCSYSCFYWFVWYSLVCRLHKFIFCRVLFLCKLVKVKSIFFYRLKYVIIIIMIIIQYVLTVLVSSIDKVFEILGNGLGCNNDRDSKLSWFIMKYYKTWRTKF